MAGKTVNMVVTVSPDELSYILLAVRFMNYQLEGDNKHILPQKRRETLEQYLETRASLKRKLAPAN